MDPLPLDDISEKGAQSRLHLEDQDHDDDEPRTLQEAHWRAQPGWVKVLTVVIGVPSFGYLWFADSTDPFETSLGAASLIGFGLVAILQLLFVFRAYWRMDI